MILGVTRIDVEGGLFLVRPSLVDSATCGRLRGRWDRARKAYTFPATPENAAILATSFKVTRTTPGFEAFRTPQVSGVAGDGVSGDLAVAVAPEVVVPEVLPARRPAEPEFVQPEGIKSRLWAHQVAAIRFCMGLFAKGRRGILLNLGMGTGKTITALTLLLLIAARRTLVLCPLRVVQVWVFEIATHLGIEVIVVALDESAGSVAEKLDLAKQKLKLAETLGVPFICIINYDSAWREPIAIWLEYQRWDAAVADEIHRVKSPSGRASMFMKRLRRCAAYRLGLTGTPMPHGPMDVYAQFRFLDITIFGPSFTAFRAKYAVMGGYQRKEIVGFQNLAELESLMGQITFRVGSEVLDLPPATHVTYYCELGPEGRRAYKEVDKEFVTDTLLGKITANNALARLTRLRQIANGIAVPESGIDHRIDNSKLNLLIDVLKDIGKDEPVVVFCCYHMDLDGVHEACQKVEFTSMELSGRRDELKQWQDGGAQVLAVQIQAGGVGINLVRARYSIYYSQSFSLGDYDQSQKRIHRPGQTRPVEYIHLVARNTVDVKIMRALERRADIVQSILAEIKNTASSTAN